MPKMTEAEIQAQLQVAKGWERVGDMLVRTWQFSATRRALTFVNDAATLAEKVDHHPDIILSYRSVRIELSTHSEGGLTPRDFELAAQLSALPTDR
ncbi:MAG: 4a-hydroxytetrahydrobiopterin dehydratase [Isosphaeraceae bacterium]